MPASVQSPIEQVLDLARWAPSGDNTQPWRFQIVSPIEALIHTFDTRHHCVYDLTGAPSQIAVGALLETVRIAATGVGMRADIARLPTATEERLRFSVRLVAEGIQADDLVHQIEARCTNRRPYSRRPLTREQKSLLETSVGRDIGVVWLDGDRRREVARLMFESAGIRLTIPEAYAVHREVIEWHARFSESKIPDQAVGLDPVGMLLMRWAMKSWQRTNILSNYLGGALLPRIQLELLPGLMCAAHVALVAPETPERVDDFVRAGAAAQRLWLTATKLGLQMQPEMTPLIFAGYVRTGRHFSRDFRASSRATIVAGRLVSVLGESAAQRTVWMARIGFAGPPRSRSLRLPMSELRVR